MERRVLVTGGSGLVGVNLLNGLVSRFDSNPNSDLKPHHSAAQTSFWEQVDLLSMDTLVSVFEEFRPNHIVNLAARAECDEETAAEKANGADTYCTDNGLKAVKSISGAECVIITSAQFVINKGKDLSERKEDYFPVNVDGKRKILKGGSMPHPEGILS